jgi:hypothetical protein
MILVASSLTKSAVAGDADRLANCAAAADMASAAAKSRDAGVSPDRTTAIIYQQAPEALKGEVNATVAEVYNNSSLTPDQASSKVMQRCLEIETE